MAYNPRAPKSPPKHFNYTSRSTSSHTPQANTDRSLNKGNHDSKNDNTVGGQVERNETASETGLAEDDDDVESDSKPHVAAPSIAQDTTVDDNQWMGLLRSDQNTGGTVDGSPEMNSQSKPTGRLRASSSSSASSGVAATEFDVPDDDDDYAALDNLSQVSDDLHIENEESTFIRDALQADNAWSQELTNYEHDIDWNDANTYNETPTGMYHDIMESYGMPDTPLTQLDPSVDFTNDSRYLLPAFGENDIDPHLGQSLFRSFSLTSDSSSSTASEALVVKPEESPELCTPDTLAGDSNDSDTDVEDMTEELAQRAEMLERRKKAERRSKKSKKHKSRSKSLDSESGTMVLKKFPINPKRPLAYTVSTPKGSVLRFTMPKSGNLKFHWVTGRTRPKSLELSPMTPAYANAMQGRLFQLYHCPTEPNLAPRRSQTMSGDFGRSSSFSGAESYSVQRNFTASGGLSSTFFIDLDNVSDDGDDDYGIMDLLDLDNASETESSPTPLHNRTQSLPGRVLELDDDEAEFHATALSSPARCLSPVTDNLPSSVMDQSPSATKRRYSDTSDVLIDFEAPATKRQSLHGPQAMVA